MKTSTQWYFSVAFFLAMATAYSQGIVTGVVFDAETNTPLPGASVTIKGTTQGAATDYDGKFSLQTSQNKGTLVISYIGFMKSEVSFVVSGGKASVQVKLQPDAQVLGEVVVTGSALLDIAKERQTPVAVSTVKAAEIVEKIGNQELPEVLNRTPSVYATKSGGGYGDARINIRGFAQENIAVMINGMPVNDMENSRVYWSNWAGLVDVTSAMQVQRGLGASKLAIASVGGTINIVTRSADMKEGGFLYAGIYNNDRMKNVVSYNTGKSNKGWSASVLIGRDAGSYYADATEFESYNYFFGLGYNPSEKHSFQFMITGAPQWHNQRTSSVRISDAIKYGGSADKPNRRYNSDWGYLNGNPYSIRRNAFHKPVMTLNWDWNISEASKLGTVVYASFGRGFGTSEAGSIGRDVTNNTNNHQFLRNFRDRRTGLYNFDALVQANQTSNPTNGHIVRRASINSHDWYGFLSNFNHKLNDKWTFSIGLDGRYYYGYHYQTISDFLGASAYYDEIQVTRNNIVIERKSANANLATPNRVTSSISDKPNYNPFGGSIDPIENKISYSNDGEVRWLGTFGQLEYTNDIISAFVQGSVSVQGYQRIDEFLKEGTLARAGNPDTAMKTKTGFEDILGYNIKTGINYNINEQHNVFANVGYYSKQPSFGSVYRSNQNYLTPNNVNEKIFGVELGYGFKTSNFNANLNLYHTAWNDRYLRRSSLTDTDINRTNYYAEISNLNEVHQGVEFDASYRINDYVRLNGMISVGNWYYKGNASVLTFDNSNNPYTLNGKTSNELSLFIDKAKVSDAAQQTAAFGIDVTPIERLKFSCDWRYVNELYANIDFYAFSNEKTAEKGTLQLPSYNLFDLGVSYKLPLVKKQTMTFAFNVNNLLDTYYISESYDNIHAKTLEDFSGNQTQYDNYRNNNLYKGIDTSNRVYFGAGRTWNFSIRYNF